MEPDETIDGLECFERVDGAGSPAMASVSASSSVETDVPQTPQKRLGDGTEAAQVGHVMGIPGCLSMYQLFSISSMAYALVRAAFTIV